MTVLEVKPHKVYIRDLVPYRTAVMFSWLLFCYFTKKQKIPTLSAGKLECRVILYSKTCFAVGLFTIPILSKKKG